MNLISADENTHRLSQVVAQNHFMESVRVAITATYTTHSCVLLNHFLPALAFGPQFARGFSGNRANFRRRDGGLASFLISKLAFTLLKGREEQHTQKKEGATVSEMSSAEGAKMMNANGTLVPLPRWMLLVSFETHS